MDKCQHEEIKTSLDWFGCRVCRETWYVEDVFKEWIAQQARIKELEGESEKRKVAIWLLLDHVDYTENNCRINEMVAATLPVEIIVKAKEALKEKEE